MPATVHPHVVGIILWPLSLIEQSCNHRMTVYTTQNSKKLSNKKAENHFGYFVSEFGKTKSSCELLKLTNQM